MIILIQIIIVLISLLHSSHSSPSRPFDFERSRNFKIKPFLRIHENPITYGDMSDKITKKIKGDVPLGFIDSILRIIASFKNTLPEAYHKTESKNSREIELPSYGIVGDVVNDIANSILHTITVWIYQ